MKMPSRRFLAAATVAGIAAPFGWYCYQKINSTRKHQGQSKVEMGKTTMLEQPKVEETALQPGPQRYPYVLVGGGTASYYAALTIRGRDPDAKVVIISEETESPYNRSKLSKVLTPKQLDEVHYEVDGYYPALENLCEAKNGGVSLIRNKRVERIDAEKQTVELEGGESVGFDKCLIATGSQPKKHPLLEEVQSYHTIEDNRRLAAQLSKRGQALEFGVVGGGLLGCELSKSLNEIVSRMEEPKFKVAHIVEDAHVLKPLLPKLLAYEFEREMRNAGVKLISDAAIKSTRRLEDGKWELQLSKAGEGQQFQFDHILVDAGVQPRSEVAEASGFEIDEHTGGIMADSRMHVKGNVWAAGDVCSFYDPQLRRRRLVTHWEHACATGRVAGENMTGGDKEYTHQAAFDSILFDGNDEGRVFLTGVGDVDTGRNKTVIVHQKKMSPTTEKTHAVVFYMDKDSGRVVGSLLYNVQNVASLDVARKLLADKRAPSLPQLVDFAKVMLYPSKEEGGDQKTKSSGDDGA